ncbi:hypothetical protein KBD59_04740 [Candidatus Gracilibacteria bacterium]|nr:hypothetical protein [Candidatus Gracilibacteria bacterium]
MSFIFLIGKHAKLSIAEIAAVCGSDNVQWEQGQGFVEVEQLPVASVDLLQRLGGTVEIIEILQKNVPHAAIEKEVTRIVLEAAQFQNKKFFFGVNFWPEREGGNPTRIRKLLMSIKKMLKENSLRGAFANNEGSNVNRVFVGKQGMDAIGTNVWIIKEEKPEHVSIGVTRAVQDIDAYSQRDYEKPYRDAVSGMLPPKLAQVMINLGVGDGTPLVYDPFCGSGTILGEALLMGFNVAGSDKDAAIIDGAQQNVDWLRAQFRVPPTREVRLFTKSATQVTQENVIGRNSLNPKDPKKLLTVITEPYLGPPLRQSPSPAQLNKIMGELSMLYMDFFENLASWIPKGTTVVFAFPLWNLGNSGSEKGRHESIADQLIARIEGLGYTLSAFDPFQDVSLIYSRPDQQVAREIVRFVKS